LTAAKNDDPRMNVRLPAIIILGFVWHVQLWSHLTELVLKEFLELKTGS
jgi:hypothetical protein